MELEFAYKVTYTYKGKEYTVTFESSKDLSDREWSKKYDDPDIFDMIARDLIDRRLWEKGIAPNHVTVFGKNGWAHTIECF